jgi:hypothetical protein
MQSLNNDGKWNNVTVNNITIDQCTELEKDLDMITGYDGIEVNNRIERYFNCLWLIRNGFTKLPSSL